MSIKQRSAARAHRNAIQRASRHRAGGIFVPSASASYYDDARKPATDAQEAQS